jgi:hypothetical protein
MVDVLKHKRAPILALIAALTSPTWAATSAPTGVPAKRVIGTWELVSDEFRRPNGKVIPFPGLGPHARGLLMYDSSGRMAVHIVAPDRAPTSFESLKDVGCDELRAALRGYRGYFGTYRIDARAGTITHYVTGSVFPALVGQSLTRRFRLTGNNLVLESPESARGEKGIAVIQWKRVP